MYSVLIVDDEPLITEGLSILIDWNKYGFTDIVTASNGDEALAKTKNKKFNLIITDIRMPGLNGLDLIKALKAKNSSTNMIIISGYSEFSYAKEAIQYGVKDYLLKPVSKDELIEIVISIKNQLDEELKNYIIATKKNLIIKDKALLDIVTGMYSSIETLNNVTDFTLDFSSQYYCIYIVEVDYLKILMESSLQDCELTKFGIRNILSELFEQNNIGYIYEDTDNLLGILLHSNLPDFFEKDLYDYISQATAYIKKIFKIDTRNFLGNVTNNFQGIRFSRNEALFARERKFIFNDLPVIPYSKVALDRSLDISIEWDNTLLLSSVGEMDTNSIDEQIAILIEEITSKKMNKDIINIIMYNNIFSLQNLIKDHNGDPLYILNNETIISFINSYDEIKSLATWFKDICIKVGAYLIELGKLKSPNLIQDIKDYIDNNYSLDLSLKSIASIYYLNPAYLGRIFKNSTQESFNDYLNKKRISEAKKMFISSNLKLQDILEKVGYKNPEYFYRLFKKYEGCSFSEYSGNIKQAIKKN